MRSSSLLAICAMAACAAITELPVKRWGGVDAGHSAPRFSLAAHDGRTVTLDDELSRRHVVLVFYRGHW